MPAARPAARQGPRRKPPAKSRPRWIVRVLRFVVLCSIAVWVCMALGIVLLRWVNPLTTSVQIERRLQALFTSKPYHKRYEFVPLRAIAPSLQHAAVAAEDARFYQHHGFDWNQVEKVIEASKESGRVTRGASTITQQLVKNLFLTTSRSVIRKGIEASLVPVAEFALGKQRILELYLNVVEWGPGVYGAQAASQYWYREPVSRVTREQAARLAAILPAPRRWHPARMDDYSATILHRMAQMGW